MNINIIRKNIRKGFNRKKKWVQFTCKSIRSHVSGCLHRKRSENRNHRRATPYPLPTHKRISLKRNDNVLNCAAEKTKIRNGSSDTKKERLTKDVRYQEWTEMTLGCVVRIRTPVKGHFFFRRIFFRNCAEWKTWNTQSMSAFSILSFAQKSLADFWVVLYFGGSFPQAYKLN